MFLTGDDRYLAEKYRYFTDYTQTYYSSLFEKNTVLGRWLRSQNIIIQINDYLFLHASISPQFAAYEFPFPDINLKVQQYLHSNYKLQKGSPEDIILGSIGPQWYRGYIFQHETWPEVSQQFVDS